MRRHFELFLFDVFPNVHFGPVGEREHAHVLAGIHPGVVKIPDFRALIFGIPLAEGIAEAEETFLRAGLFLVAPRAADGAVELKFLDRAEQPGICSLFRLTSPWSGSPMPAITRHPPCGRSASRRVPLRAGRGTRSVREIRGRSRRSGTASGCRTGGTPFPPGAAGRWNPCRRKRAGRDARIRRRLHA